jgi:hypothetical protein
VRRRLSREVNNVENSVNIVDSPFSTTSQIVGGGCYDPSLWGSAKFKSPANLKPISRRWIAIAALALITIVLFALLRYFSRK